jgi:hypothetical protein
LRLHKRDRAQILHFLHADHAAAPAVARAAAAEVEAQHDITERSEPGNWDGRRRCCCASRGTGRAPAISAAPSDDEEPRKVIPAEAKLTLLH